MTARRKWEGGPPVADLQDTLIYDLERKEQVGFIEPAVWLPVGSVIELGNPNRDPVVFRCRVQVRGSTASILVDANVGEPGETIARHPADREPSNRDEAQRLRGP